jgi:hypothetical protein
MLTRTFTLAGSALIGLCLLASPSPSQAFDPFTPMTRAETFNSPRGDLPDQQFQDVKFRTPIAASLITATGFGVPGWRSLMLNFHLAGGSLFSVQLHEGQPDVIIPLPRAALIERVSVRCDSFSTDRCRYSISLVGE